MGDQGFNFSQPPRRERKTFEPPPWERDRFEKQEIEPEQTKPPSELVDKVPHVIEPNVEGQALGASAEQKQKAPDDKMVAAMLIGLKADEVPAMREVWKVAIAAAVLIGVIGIVLIMWGMAALVTARRTGQLGLFGGVVLLLFGAGFIGAGLWLVDRTLRQRGVL